MIELKVTSNLKEITAKLQRFVSDFSDKAVVRALNKVAQQAVVAGSRAVRAQGYGISSSAVKKSFRIEKATAKNLVVVLRSTGKPIGLIHYGARQTPSGVSVNVLNGKQVLSHAFIATMKSGHVGVFERVGAARSRVTRPDAPQTKAIAQARASGKKRGKLALARHAGVGNAVIKASAKAGRRPNLPIRELYGPSVPSALTNPAVQAAIMARIREQLPKVLAQELNFIRLKG